MSFAMASHRFPVEEYDDTDEQSDDHIHRARSGRVPRTGASVFVNCNVSFSWCGCFTHLEVSEPSTIGILWWLLPVGMIDKKHLQSFPIDCEGGAESFQLLIMVWSFLSRGSIMKPPRVTSIQ